MLNSEVSSCVPSRSVEECQEAGIAALVELAQRTAPTVKLPVISAEPKPSVDKHTGAAHLNDSTYIGVRPQNLGPPIQLRRCRPRVDASGGNADFGQGRHHALAARSNAPEVGGRDATRQVGKPLRVSVVVPTRNEAGNVGPLLARLSPVLAGLGGEVLFVDDSDDGTPAAVAGAGRSAAVPVRLMHRTARERSGGLGGAVAAGLATVSARWAVVMDGDLQHPPEEVAHLLAAADCDADLVVASRYCADGSARGLSSHFRGMASVSATACARLLFPRILAGVSDPMSGFFAVRTAAVHPVVLRPRGFKILLELLVRTPGLRVAEVPFAFAERHTGDSKASWREATRYMHQLVTLRLAAARRVARLIRFAVVGGSGMVVNLLVLAVLLRAQVGGQWVGGQVVAAIAATQVAIGWNFALTERWVFPSRPGHWAGRLVPFWALNCVALLVQLPLAAWLQPLVGGSYLLAMGTALAILTLARFAVCDRWLYRPGGRRRVPGGR